MSDLEGELQQCKLSLATIEQRVQAIDHALRGNGRKGLYTEFELLKSKVEQLEEFRSDMKRTKQWAATAAVTMLGQLFLQALSALG